MASKCRLEGFAHLTESLAKGPAHWHQESKKLSLRPKKGQSSIVIHTGLTILLHGVSWEDWFIVQVEINSMARATIYSIDL